jgi:glyoxylase I family protein
MDLLGIHHIALITGRYGASKAFYTEVLGFTVIRETYRKDRDSYKLDLSLNGQYMIELFTFREAPERPSYPEARGLRHLAFAVADIDAAVRELETKGVAVQPVRVDELTGQRYVFFADPDGQPLELYEH